MEEEFVVNILREKFPSHEFKLIDFIDRYPSKLYIYWKIKKENKEKILVKQYEEIKEKDLLNEYFYQESFYNKCPEGMAPNPILVDEQNNILVMEYIEGKTLKMVLLGTQGISDQTLRQIIDKSALALAHFHTIFKRSSDVSYVHTLNFFNNYILKDHITLDQEEFRTLNKLGLNNISNSFIDFSPPNIMVNSSSVYLVDFPNRDQISTPHTDLARFRFYLKLLKQHPYFKFIRLNWWDPEKIFQQFLKTYCNSVGASIEKSDMYIIDKLQKEFAKELDLYYKRHSGVKNFVKKIYLRPFIRGLLNKKVCNELQ